MRAGAGSGGASAALLMLAALAAAEAAGCGGGAHGVAGGPDSGLTDAIEEGAVGADVIGASSSGSSGAGAGDSSASQYEDAEVGSVLDAGLLGETGGPWDGDAGADSSKVSACVPWGCADYPAGTCGQQSDHCGGTTSACTSTSGAGLCPLGQFCGGGGPSLCGASVTTDACVPLTCAQAGSPCGQVADGCGGLLPTCVVCNPWEWCGGGGPNICG
jgi:hypothetical protein